jgi:hypothetical protein
MPGAPHIRFTASREHRVSRRSRLAAWWKRFFPTLADVQSKLLDALLDSIALVLGGANGELSLRAAGNCIHNS